MCPCQDSYKLSRLKDILSHQIRWYEENKYDKDYVYDESWRKMLELPRGAFDDILEILSS